MRSAPATKLLITVCSAALLLAAASAQAADYSVVTQRGGSAFDALIVGDYAYVGQGSTLVTVAVEQPASMPGLALQGIVDEPLVSRSVPGYIRGLAGTSERLYVAWHGQFSEVTVSEYSLAQPERPEFLGALDVPGLESLKARDLAVVGDVLYVLADELVAIDVSDPDQPSLGASASSDLLFHLEPVGPNHLLAFNTDPGGILFGWIYDISSPLVPRHAQFFNSVGHSPTVARRDHLVAFFSGGFKLFDFSNPNAPTYLSGESFLYGHSGVLLERHLLVATEGELRIWDISDPRAPLALPSVSVPIGRSYVATSSHEDRAFFFDEAGRALQLDLSDPRMPVVEQVAVLPVGGSPAHVARQGTDLLVGQDWGELRRTNRKLATLATPQPVDDLATRGLSVDGDRALLIDAGVGVHYLDLSNPGDPQVLGTVPLGYSTAPLLDGDRGWVAKDLLGDDGLLTLDLSQPGSPQITHTLDLTLSKSSLRLDGDRLYVATGNTISGLQILDVSGAVPVELGAYTGCQARDVDIRGTLAAIACGEREMHLLDVSDPGRPSLLGVYLDPDHFVPQPGSVLFVEDDLVFMGFAGGVDAVDVSDPANPQRNQRFEIGGAIGQMIPAEGGGVWAAGQHGGLALIQESGVAVAPQILDKPSTLRRRVD